jgi:hypothetical protein
MFISPTIVRLANQPTDPEILRRLITIMGHKDFLPNIPGRHERLMGRARRGATQPGVWCDLAIKGSVRLARSAGRAAARDDIRAKRRRAVMARGETTLKPPRDVSDEQRQRFATTMPGKTP